MNLLEIAGAVLLGGIVLAGCIVKHLTRKTLRDMDGVSDIFLSGKQEDNIMGKF